MPTISVVIVTKNEEENIHKCLNNLSWADEIILVDMFSTDKTVEIAKKFTDKIYFSDHYLNDVRKNFGSERALCDWILNIDADEIVTEELKNEIRQVIRNDEGNCGYFIAFKHYFMNKWIRFGGWYPCRLIRLFKKNKGRFTKEDEHQLMVIDGPIGCLKNAIIHKGPENPKTFARKHDLYSTNIAKAAFAHKENVSLKKLIIRPSYIFIKRYIFQRGFLDGIPGLILMSQFCYYLFLEQLKLWKLCKNDKKTYSTN